ncbi:hypothetical protein LSH36_691g01009, partial [Paralvinella palmiformis]
VTTLHAATDYSCLCETCNCDKATTSGDVHHEPASQGRLCCHHAINKEFIGTIQNPEICSRFLRMPCGGLLKAYFLAWSIRGVHFTWHKPFGAISKKGCRAHTQTTKGHTSSFAK